jgi:UDP-N-acetylglucosamine 3-dehydrogenase
MTTKIGVLSFAHGHAHAYAAALAARDGVEFVGIADPDKERGAAAARRYGTVFYDTEAALLDCGLDGVVITSENVRHRPLVEQAARAGVPLILCEKPLATTLEDARAMIEICARHGAQLKTAFPCRFSPPYARLREQVRSGAIGEVLAIRGTNRGRMPGGWFIEPALSGGGAVIDHTVHVADLNRWLLGKEATEVYAEIGNNFHHQSWDDTGFLTITYDGGVFATLDTSWSRPKSYPTWGDVTLQIIGTEGVADLNMFAQVLTHYDDRDRRVDWPGWGSSMDDGMIGEFFRAAAGLSAPTLATGEDGLRALEVALAAYRSAEIRDSVLLR